MVIEFTEKDAYEVFGETERSDAMSYDADTEGNTVTVTLLETVPMIFTHSISPLLELVMED